MSRSFPRRILVALASVSAAALSVTALAAPAASAPAPTPLTPPAQSPFDPTPTALTADQQAAVSRATVASAKNPAGVYLVQLAGEPLAAYSGGVPGLAATRPAPGQNLDTTSPAARRYAGYLATRRAAATESVGGAEHLYDYSVVFNGFAAKLTAGQAALLRARPGVLAVTRNDIRHLDTNRTPEQLGLTGPNGVWARQFGGPGKAGDGVIVGDIDSGLWPESRSFAALPAQSSDAGVKARFKGVCEQGIERPFFTCNSKVIGARWYVRGFDAGRVQPEEYLSPRDYGGHGSHTASTAAGDYGVPVTVDGTDLGKVSGMAPDARLAVYKVCWNDDVNQGGCATADIVAAIEAAVSDGVDVINFSISGALSTVYDPVEIGFYNAAKAGIFVAASAGNSGPTASTVAHNDPWLTTVAAGTKDRKSVKSVTLGNGMTYQGVGLGAAVPSSPLITASSAAAVGAPAQDAALCFPNTLDPGRVAGTIVVCDRGVNARTEKSAVVKAAGGVGMVLANTSPSSLNADLHSIPTVHVDEIAGAAIKSYLAGVGAKATASLSVGTLLPTEAPRLASFSSRGPALAGDGDLLKPDIMAPGVDVLAAVAPPGNSGRHYDFYSGTSMASPHIAGIASLIISKHPDWTPAAVKSAMMTTATTTTNRGNPITVDNGAPAGALDYGAGQVRPAPAFDPGLIYQAGASDWDRFGCNYAPVTPGLASCVGVTPLDPSDLNYPSIAIGSLAGQQTVTRTVTNVSATTSTYRASGTVPAGFRATVSPASFTIKPGASATYQLTVTRTSAPFDTYAEGSVVFSDGKHSVRSPVVVKPVLADSPSELSFTGTTGTQTGSITAGFTGKLITSVHGLVPADVSAVALVPQGPTFDATAPAESPRAKKVTVTVPQGTTLLRYATYDADYPPGTDVDVYVYQAGTANLVGISATGTAQESVTIRNPPAGTYDVYVDLYSNAAVTAKLNTFIVGNTAAGNLLVRPSSQQVTVGQPFRISVTHRGLAPGRRWLGWGALSDGSNQRVTIVSGTS